MRLGILVEGVEEVEGGLEKFREVELVSRRLGGEGVEVISLGFSMVAWCRNNNLQSLLCRKLLRLKAQKRHKVSTHEVTKRHTYEK